MTITRRIAVLIGLTPAVVVGASLPASWTASASRGLSGYLVKAHLNDGTVYPMAQTVAGTLSTSQSVDAGNLVYQPRLSVTTLTSYGWTAQSALTGYVSC